MRSAPRMCVVGILKYFRPCMLRKIGLLWAVLWDSNMPKMYWRPGLRPGLHWGETHNNPPDPLVGWEGEHTLPIPHPLGAFSASILAPSALRSSCPSRGILVPRCYRAGYCPGPNALRKPAQGADHPQPPSRGKGQWQIKARRPRRPLTKRASTSILVPKAYFRNPWCHNGRYSTRYNQKNSITKIIYL